MNSIVKRASVRVSNYPSRQEFYKTRVHTQKHNVLRVKHAYKKLVLIVSLKRLQKVDEKTTKNL
jgi:hypothetical protein